MSGFSCPHCGKVIDLFKTGGGQKAALELHVPFLGGIVLDPDIVKNCDNGVPFVEINPDSKAAKAFFEISNLVEMESMDMHSNNTRNIYGCPECNKLFMD